MRIAVFTGHFHPHVGGVELYTRAIFSRLVKRGHAVALVTSSTGGGQPRESVDGIEVARLPVLPLFSARYPILLPGPGLRGRRGLVEPLPAGGGGHQHPLLHRQLAGHLVRRRGAASPTSTSSTAPATSGWAARWPTGSRPRSTTARAAG